MSCRDWSEMSSPDNQPIERPVSSNPRLLTDRVWFLALILSLGMASAFVNIAGGDWSLGIASIGGAALASAGLVASQVGPRRPLSPSPTATEIGDSRWTRRYNYRSESSPLTGVGGIIPSSHDAPYSAIDARLWNGVLWVLLGIAMVGLLAVSIVAVV